MAQIREFFVRLDTFIRPAQAERALAQEVDAHLGLIEDALRRRGLTPDAARVAARRSFGGVDQAKEQSRAARSFVWLEDALRDTRLAPRRPKASGPCQRPSARRRPRDSTWCAMRSS